MENLKTIVTEYLSKPSDYAIQITGNWGTGKTYYYKNTLSEIISSSQVHNNNNKSYKPIYISLFGLKSIDDIATKIVFEFYYSTIFKKYYRGIIRKRIIISQNILKVAFRGFLGFYKLGSVKEYATDLGTIGKDILDTNELLICFDDIERKDSSLNIEDFVGYINSLVDEGIKVLILSNEDKLLPKSTLTSNNTQDIKSNYKDLKEKTIGISVEFFSKTDEVINSIIEERYASFSIFKAFLTEQKVLITTFTNSIDNNFRTLKYTLDTLHHIHSIITKDIFNTDTSIKQLVKEELPNIAAIILAYSAEYKLSNLKHSNKQDYSKPDKLLDQLFAKQNQQPLPEYPYDKFIEKYKIEDGGYRFYETIYNHISSLKDFDSNEFIDEFNSLFHLNEGNIQPHYEIFGQLSYDTCFSISSEEYQEKTKELIKFAAEGIFLPSEYITIMHFSERFDNVLSLNLKDVQQTISSGLKKAINNQQLNSELNFSQFEMSGKFQTLTENIQEVYNDGMQEIKDYRDRREKEKIENVLSQLITNPEEFLNKYRQESNLQNALKYYPILKILTPQKIFTLIIESNNLVVQFIDAIFSEKYKHLDDLNKERIELQELHNLLNKHVSTITEKTINRHLLISLVTTIGKFIV